MNEEYLELWNFCKSLDSITYSTYYYINEKYRSICEEILWKMHEEQLNKLRIKYKNPIKFTEEYFCVELLWYQKLLLKAMYEKDDLPYRIGRRF
jgi:hypothetical protein